MDQLRKHCKKTICRDLQMSPVTKEGCEKFDCLNDLSNDVESLHTGRESGGPFCPGFSAYCACHSSLTWQGAGCQHRRRALGFRHVVAADVIGQIVEEHWVFVVLLQ